MAALHDALTSLSPLDWTDVPQDDLSPFVGEILKSAELICSSVPPPADGVPFNEAKPSTSTPNTATSHKDMTISTARSPPSDEEYEQLQSSWGKHLKFSSKENPLGVAVYKMAGKDRHGAWYARRSVHEGMGFTKFRDAMKREFEQSLHVQGGAGAGCIRGIGADKKLEHFDLEDDGELEVYQLSAQFPGPTTPREFISMIVTSEAALSEKSASVAGISSSVVPRHFIIVSRPIIHPDAAERSGYIRGQYESVELIREIPLHQDKSKSTPNLLAGGGKEKAEDAKHAALKRANTDLQPSSSNDEAVDPRELNPVEWIMVTRSDPGGGIPRFMVDRGTPSTMLGDVHKFLDWAARSGEHSETTKLQSSAETDDNVREEPPAAAETKPSGGIFQHLAHTLEAGLDAYAPAMVSSFVHNRLDSHDLHSDSSDLSDTDSFTSATERRATPLAKNGSSESISIASIQATAEAGDRKLDDHEKKLLDIGKQRDKLERKLAKKREEEDQRLKKAQDNEESESTKAQERYDKEIKKQEEKHRKEMDKLEARKAKEAKKLEQKRQKQLDRDALHKVTRERDEFRSQVDLLKRENAVLRERIEHLESNANAESEKA